MAIPRVLILGGGFGGLRVARGLRHAAVKITLVDRTNHHLFQPLLYQVAASALASRDIAYPIREVLKRQENVTVIMDQAVRIDTEKRRVEFTSGRIEEYDYLVVAVGARHSYFGHQEWEQYAPGLKTLEDALLIRRKILTAFEKAEATDSRQQSDSLLQFVVIGGGPTGVELAGAIAEIAHRTMLRNFRRINPSDTRIYLIEGTSRILPSYPPELSLRAQKDLEQLGVTVLTDRFVEQIDQTGVKIKDRLIDTNNVFWAAGNEAPPLLHTLNVPLDRQNRVLVGPDLTIPGHPEVFVIGDAACYLDSKGVPLPGIAPVAIQQGQYVARVLGKAQRPPYKNWDKGSMATIGKARAVAVMGRWKFTGFIAWFLWCFVHILFLIDFRNRMIVMTEWMFWYTTGQRSSRLIYEAIEDE